MAEEGSNTHDDRGPRIPPAKIQSINPEPTIGLFYKAHNSAPSIPVDVKFPRDAAMVFCDRIRHDLMDYNPKAFIAVGVDLNSFKEVIGWIKECVDLQKVERFREIDDDDPEVLKKYALIAAVSHYVGIPNRDLGEHLLKRMIAISRKAPMNWADVEWFYTSPALNAVSEVRNVGAASVFYAWWQGKLDSEETPEEMARLDVLRKMYPQLDNDLHKWCEKNQADVERKWEEKRTKRVEDAASGGAGAGTNWGDEGRGASTGTSWDSEQPAAQSTGSWATTGNTYGNSWETDNAGQAGGSNFTSAPVDNAWESGGSRVDTPADSFDSHASGYNSEAFGAKGYVQNFSKDGMGGCWADEVNDNCTIAPDNISPAW